MGTVINVRPGPATRAETHEARPPRPRDAGDPDADWAGPAPADLDLPEGDCPPDVVDRLLWRNAQRIMSRHAVRLNGTCRWCGQEAPCDARRLAVRAVEVARLPWREAWYARNEITGLLPVVTAQLRRGGPLVGRPSPGDGHRDDQDGGSPERPRPVARSRTRTWVRVTVRSPAPDDNP